MTAYGFTFYKPRTQEFDISVENTRTSNPTLASQIDADRAADSLNILVTRSQVLDAFQSLETAPVLPSETLIRQWMISGLGYKRQTFIATQNSLFNSDSTYAKKIKDDRLFQDNVISPLTLSQSDNENGYPSQSTQDSFGNNKTAFLLGIDDGTGTGDLRYFLPSSTVNGVTRDSKFYSGAIFSGNSYIYTQINPAILNNGGNSSFSFEAWIFRFSSNREESIVSRIGASSQLGNNQLGFDLYINSSNYLVWEQPPYATITGNIQIPANTWTHVVISYQYSTVTANSTYGRRMYVNGQLCGSRYNTIANLVTEPFTTRINGFAGSLLSYLGGFYNAVTVQDSTGFSINDKVRVYGYLPSGQDYLTGSEFTVTDIDYSRNIIELYEANVYNTGGLYSTPNGYPILVRSSIPENSASKRGVIARAVSYPNRIFLEPLGRPTGYSGSYSGTQEMSSSGAIRDQYQVGDKVMFTGTSRGGANLNQIYYITSVVTTGSFGGYITVGLNPAGYSYNSYYDTTFDYWTDNGNPTTIAMYMVKIPDSMTGGSDMPGLSTTLLSTNRKTRNSDTTKFKGIFGGARFVNNATPYSADTYSLSSAYPLTTYGGGGSTNLLINSNNGTVPINTGQGSLNLGYYGQNEILIATTPKYLGTVFYNGNSTYSAVNPGTYGASLFTMAPGTDWCAEAWIYPLKTQAAGIIGSGITGPNFWALVQQTDNNIVFYWDNTSITGSVTYDSNEMTNVNNVSGLSTGLVLTGSGIATGTTITAIDSVNKKLTLSAKAIATVSGTSYSYIGGSAQVAQLTSNANSLSINDWSHVAVSLNGNTLRLFLNGTIVASTTIAPRYFKQHPTDSNYYVGLHAGAYFYGYIASPRLVNGKSIYTSNFTVSTTKPRASRMSVLGAYAVNPRALVIPDEKGIQYWMWHGFDTYSTVQFKSTDITWNQVDAFYQSGNTSVTKTYPFCVGKEFLVNQTLIGTPDINQAYYSNIITTDSSTGSVSVSGGNVDAYITVLMR